MWQCSVCALQPGPASVRLLTAPLLLLHSTSSFRLMPTRIYIEPRHGSKREITGETRYSPLHEIVGRALEHCYSATLALETSFEIIHRTFRKSHHAQVFFRAKFPHDKAPTSAMVERYLRETPPDVVVKECKDPEGQGRLLWGNVLKGTSAEAQTNELNLSLELVQALICPDPISMHTKTQTETLRIYHKWLLATTYLHELQHSLTKHFFSSNLTTPLAATPGAMDRHKHGEAGTYFEAEYLGFHLMAEWETEEERQSSKALWTMKWLVAGPPRVSSANKRLLSPATIAALYDSLATESVHQVNLQDEARMPLAAGAIRQRVGVYLDQDLEAEGEVESEEEERVTADHDLIGVGVMPRERVEITLFNIC
ncbi:hypothetical protein C8R47DRAFT_60266 [Mycena vitilis]|nr:hypothetical protein C8R47DRAFT_60266 [Mycena vitilis]